MKIIAIADSRNACALACNCLSGSEFRRSPEEFLYKSPHKEKLRDGGCAIARTRGRLRSSEMKITAICESEGRRWQNHDDGKPRRGAGGTAPNAFCSSISTRRATLPAPSECRTSKAKASTILCWDETVIADKILPTRLDQLFLVPADLDLAGAEVEIARMPDHLLRLARTLQPLRADSAFDFVLLDCPPSLGILTSNALAAADEILTPIQCEYFALEGLVKIVRVVEQVRDSGANPNIQIGGILADDVRQPRQI